MALTKNKEIRLTLSNIDKYGWILTQPYASLLTKEMDLDKYCYLISLHETCRQHCPELNLWDSKEYDAFIMQGYAMLKRLSPKRQQARELYLQLQDERMVNKNHFFNYDIETKVCLTRLFFREIEILPEERNLEMRLLLDLMDDKRMFDFDIKELQDDNLTPILPVLIATSVAPEYFIEAFKSGFPLTFEHYGEEVLLDHYRWLIGDSLRKLQLEK